MNLYAILRRNGWKTAQDLQAAAERSTKVGNADMPNEVRWIRSYIMAEPDGTLGTVCIYEAISPEALKRHADKAEVVFIFNGVTLAIPGQAAGFNIGVPFETFDLETRMKDFQKKGGVINVCTPCLIHRALQDSPVLEGIVRIKGTDLMEKKDLAAKLMQFT